MILDCLVKIILNSPWIILIVFCDLFGDLSGIGHYRTVDSGLVCIFLHDLQSMDSRSQIVKHKASACSVCPGFYIAFLIRNACFDISCLVASKQKFYFFSVECKCR